MTHRFRHQPQVEDDLGRPLTDVELQEVATLDQLNDDQIAAIAAMRSRNYISPMVYVKAIVPTAGHADVRRFLDEDIQRVAIERRPPAELPNQDMFEREAGRPLRPMERARVGSFEKMSREQIALARTLARTNLATGFLYLSRIAPEETTERRHELAKHLAETLSEP